MAIGAYSGHLPGPCTTQRTCEPAYIASSVSLFILMQHALRRCSLAAASAALSLCQPPRAATPFSAFTATLLHALSSAAAMQRIIALLFPRSTYGWNNIAAVALLLSLRLPTGKFRLLLAAFLRHFLPASPSLFIACSSLAVRCMQISSFHFYYDALALPCCCRCATRGDRRCRIPLPAGNFLLLPFFLSPQCLFAPHSSMCSLSTVSALLCCALLLLRFPRLV